MCSLTHQVVESTESTKCDQGGDLLFTLEHSLVAHPCVFTVELLWRGGILNIGPVWYLGERCTLYISCILGEGVDTQ